MRRLWENFGTIGTVVMATALTVAHPHCYWSGVTTGIAMTGVTLGALGWWLGR